MIEDVKDFLMMSAEDFVEKILIDKLDTICFVCGDVLRTVYSVCRTVAEHDQGLISS